MVEQNRSDNAWRTIQRLAELRRNFDLSSINVEVILRESEKGMLLLTSKRLKEDVVM